MKKQVISLILSQPGLSLGFVFLISVVFWVSFSLGHSQLITGTIVNASLYLASLYLPLKMVYPLLFLPSLAVFSRGLLFGSLTPFLIWMMPFIWLGNWLLVFSFRKTLASLKAYWLAVVIASLLKAGFLFFSASFLFRFNLVPSLFLTTMGSLQLLTALLGGLTSGLARLLYDRVSRG